MSKEYLPTTHLGVVDGDVFLGELPLLEAFDDLDLGVVLDFAAVRRAMPHNR